jgi:hypothetical protein
VDKQPQIKTNADLVELGFMDARAKILDVAAFLDRTQHAGQDSDYRVVALKEALSKLASPTPGRVKEILMTFSDPTTEPIPFAHTQGAAGAYKSEPSKTEEARA